MKKLIRKSFGLGLALALTTVMALSMIGTAPVAQAANWVEDPQSVLKADTVAQLNQISEKISAEKNVGIYYIVTDKTGDEVRSLAQDAVSQNSHLQNTKDKVVFVSEHKSSQLHAFTSGSQTLLTKNMVDTVVNQCSKKADLDSYSTCAGEALQTTLKSPQDQNYGKQKPAGDGQSPTTGENGKEPKDTSDPAATGQAAGNEPVIDLAGVLTDKQKAGLSAKIKPIVAKYGQSVNVVLVNTVGAFDGRAHVYAADFFEAAGFGAGPDKSGIMLLVAVQSRDVAVIAHGKTMETLNKKAADDIQSYIKPDLKSKRWYQASNSFVDESERVLVAQSQGKRYKVSATATEYLIGGGISLAVGLGLSALVTWALYARHRTAKPELFAHDYVRQGSVAITAGQDVYSHSTTTSTPRPKSDSSSSSGGFSSSSGGSFSGSSSKF